MTTMHPGDPQFAEATAIVMKIIEHNPPAQAVQVLIDNGVSADGAKEFVDQCVEGAISALKLVGAPVPKHLK